MLKNLLFAANIAICASPIFSQSHTLLSQAVEKGLLNVSITSKGGHAQQCLQLVLQRVGTTPYKISIPAGHVFVPTDSSTQNIIVAKEELLTLSRPKISIDLWGFCAEPRDGSPFSGETFSIGKMASGPLLKMAEHLSKTGLFRDNEAQTAIWAMIDTTLIPTIGHAGLLSTACQIMGRPLPEIKMQRLKPAAAAPRQPRQTGPRAPAYVRAPMKVTGKFVCEPATTDVLVSAYLQDSIGQRVQTFFEKTKQPADIKATYRFEYQTSKLPPGRYEAVFYVNERPAKKIIIRY